MKYMLSFFNVLAALTVVAQPGVLDPTFGSAGFKVAGYAGTDLVCNDLVLQGDGKIILVGSAGSLNAVLVRFKANGTLDPTFELDGMVISSSVYASYGAENVVVQDDGKILISGTLSNQYLVARYNSNGSLDNTFDSDGILMVNTGASYITEAEFLLQSDGKLVIVGSADVGDGQEFCIVRLNPDGTTDNSFDGDGIVTTDFYGPGQDVPAASLIQADGKIVVVGTCDTNGTNAGFIVSRYDLDGSLDNSFSSDGMVMAFPQTHWLTPTSIAILPSGKLLISGYKHNGTDSDCAFVRLNSDGTIDTLFGDDGIVILDYNNMNNTSSSIVVQSNEKILVAGNINSANGFFVMRLNSDGTPDNSFGSGGGTSTLIQSEAISIAIAQQTDGKIVVAGYSGNNVNYSFAVARYLWGDFSEVEEQNSPSFNLFPNPVSGTFSITTDAIISDVSIKILDSQGRIISEENNVSGTQFEFDLEDYSEGIYFVQINFNGATHQLKLVKN